MRKIKYQGRRRKAHAGEGKNKKKKEEASIIKRVRIKALERGF